MNWFVGPRSLTTGDTIYFDEEIILDWEQPTPTVDVLIILTCSCTQLVDPYIDQSGLEYGESHFFVSHFMEETGVTLRGSIAAMDTFTQEMQAFEISDITIADPAANPPPVEFAGHTTLEYQIKQRGRDVKITEKAIVLDPRNPGEVAIKPKVNDQDQWLIHLQLRRKNGRERLCHALPLGGGGTVPLAKVLAGFPKGVVDAEMKKAAERATKEKHPRGVASTDLSVRLIKTDPATGGLRWAKTYPVYFPF